MTSVQDDIIFDLIEKMEEEYNESPRSPASKGHTDADQHSRNKGFSKASLAKGQTSNKRKGGVTQDLRNRLS